MILHEHVQPHMITSYLKIIRKANPEGAERTDAKAETAQCRAENKGLTWEVAQLQTLYKQVLHDMQEEQAKGAKKEEEVQIMPAQVHILNLKSALLCVVQ